MSTMTVIAAEMLDLVSGGAPSTPPSTYTYTYPGYTYPGYTYPGYTYPGYTYGGYQYAGSQYAS